MATTLENIATYISGLSVFPVSDVYLNATDSSARPIAILSDYSAENEYDSSGVAFTRSTFTFTIVANTQAQADTLSASCDAFFAGAAITPTAFGCLSEGRTVPANLYYVFQASRAYTLYET